MIRSPEVQTPFKGTLRGWPWLPLQISQRKGLLIGVDLILLNASLILGLYTDVAMPLAFISVELYLMCFAILNALWLVVATSSDNYEIRKAAQVFSSTYGIIKTLFIITAIVAFFRLVFPSPLIGWSFIFLVTASAAALLALWRIIYATVLVQPNFRRRVIIVGVGETGRTIASVINEDDTGYEVIGYLTCDEFGMKQNSKSTFPLVEWSRLTTFVEENGVSDIILAVRQDMKSDQFHAVMKCFEYGVRIVPMPDLFEEITGRIPVEHIDERWLTSLPIGWDSRSLYHIVKRAMDIYMAGTALLLWAPLFPLLGLAIKLDSPGPIFYRPERLGQRGKPFRLWKFRTMVANADSVGDPTFTAKNDFRITRVGKFLRTIHIDELPQLINVLSGEMSLIGPRPERYVPELEERIPYYRTRYVTKPGATGWALVKQGYAEGPEETLIKLQYDLYYIKHQSLSLDLLIMFKTVIHMITMRGR